MRVLVILKATPNSEAGVMPRMESIERMISFNEEMTKAGILKAPADDDAVTRLADLIWLISEFWLTEVEVSGKPVGTVIGEQPEDARTSVADGSRKTLDALLERLHREGRRRSDHAYPQSRSPCEISQATMTGS